MTEQIRSWPDALFYLSSASTANVREQLIKLQAASKHIRSLSDAATVDTNGDRLQDILTGLSLGNLSQRHKYRTLYDTVNDRFVVQRNSGTDASKTWAELLRIDSSGNLTTTGTLSTDSLTTTAGGITLGGTLDANDFYIRNLDKNIGQLRTDSLLVHDAATITGAVSVTGNLTVTGSVTVGSGSIPLATTYASTAATQNFSAATLTDVTSLTGLTLPNTDQVNTRSYLIEISLAMQDTSSINNLVTATIHNGTNGNSSDATVGSLFLSLFAGFAAQLSGFIIFTPGASNRTKFGVAINSDQNSRIFSGSYIMAKEII